MSAGNSSSIKKLPHSNVSPRVKGLREGYHIKCFACDQNNAPLNKGEYSPNFYLAIKVLYHHIPTREFGRERERIYGYRGSQCV